jgi:hypothetical protein
MKKLNKTEEMMIYAKRLGYTHVAAIVKKVFNTEYYNVNSCDDVLAAGRWIGAYQDPNFNGQRMGFLGSQMDWGVTITRERLRSMYENRDTNGFSCKN